jgi:pimeloyl-ACP methyl ester carboxylesterase
VKAKAAARKATLAILALLAVLHLVVWLGVGAMLAYPNVFRVFRDYGSPADLGLEAESVVLSGGERAWWLAHDSSKRVVVVCHGRSRGKAYMLPLIAELQKSYAVLAFDFPGHGENPFGVTSIGWRESRSVGAAVEHARSRGYSDIVLFGSSMGGASALLWLSANPSPVVKGVIADGVFARLHDFLLEYTARFHLPGYLSVGSIRLAERIAEFPSRQINPAVAISSISTPGLILHGDKDPMVPASNARALEAAAGQSFRMVIYPGRHDEPANPRLQKEVLSFIAGLR